MGVEEDLVAGDTLGAAECIMEAAGISGAERGPMAEVCIMEAGSILAEELVIIGVEGWAAIGATDLVTIVDHMVSLVATVMAGDLDLEDMG
jgi:hypothetical protein